MLGPCGQRGPRWPARGQPRASSRASPHARGRGDRRLSYTRRGGPAPACAVPAAGSLSLSMLRAQFRMSAPLMGIANALFYAQARGMRAGTYSFMKHWRTWAKAGRHLKTSGILADRQSRKTRTGEERKGGGRGCGALDVGATRTRSQARLDPLDTARTLDIGAAPSGRQVACQLARLFELKLVQLDEHGDTRRQQIGAIASVGLGRQPHPTATLAR